MEQNLGGADIKSCGGDVACGNINLNIAFNRDIGNFQLRVEQLESTNDVASPIEVQKRAVHAAAAVDNVKVARNTSMDAVDHLERVERAVDGLKEELSTLSNLLEQEDVYRRLSGAVPIPDLGTHSGLDRFRQEREQARRSDTENFGITSRSPNQNVCKIGEFCGVDEVHTSEDVVSPQKDLVSVDESSKRQVLEQGTPAMQLPNRQTFVSLSDNCTSTSPVSNSVRIATQTKRQRSDNTIALSAEYGGGEVAYRNIVFDIQTLKIIVRQLECTSGAMAHLSPIECKTLVAHATAALDLVEVDAARNTSLDAIDNLERVERSVDELVSVLKELATQSKLKNILWRKDIMNRIDKVYQHLFEAVQPFGLGAHPDVRRFQQEREQARRSDREHFDGALRSLNQNAQNIVEFLGVEKVHMPEAIVSLQKHLFSIDNSSEKHVLKQGMHTMQRLSHYAMSAPDPFVITSLDVVIYRDKRLGRGGFADTFEGTWRGTVVAVKMLSKDVPPYMFQREVDIWKRLSHPNILEFLGACSIADPPFFVCALKSNRDAIDFLRRQPAADRIKLLHETSLGLQDLHENSVIHGDIKGTNILIDEHGTACLCDFGLSRIKLHTTTVVSTPSRPFGTLQWMSPEQMSVGKITKASDIYSLGVTIYEIFTGDPPFEYMPPDTLRINVVDRKSRPIRPTDKAVTERGLDDAMWDLAEGCWSHEPLARPTADSVASRLGSIRLTSSRTEPVSGTDQSSSIQGTPTPSHRKNDWVLTDQDLIIAIMGPTGSGKSSFINIATKQYLSQVGNDLESCTLDVRAIRYHHPGVRGLDVVFVDTPNFDDTTRLDCDILKSISVWLKKTYEGNIKLSGILYFHSITDTRARGPSLTNLEMFKELCGEEALQNVVFTTSMWDKVTKSAGSARETELRKGFWQPFIAHRCRVARFFHTYESAWDIMDKFKNPRPRRLRLQKVDERKPLPGTLVYRAIVRCWNRINKFRGRRGIHTS